MKILLREFRQDDLIYINRWANNSDVTEQVIDSEIFAEPHSLEMTQGFLNSCFIKDEYQKIFVVADIQEEKYLGQVRLYELDMQARSCKIDIVLGEPEFWNRGIGKRAITELIQVGYDSLNMRTFQAEVPVSNNRAVSLFSALNFKPLNNNNGITLYSVNLETK